MELRCPIEIKNPRECPAQGGKAEPIGGFVPPAGRLNRLAMFIRRTLPQVSQPVARDDGLQAQNAVLRERIMELEDVLADYALQFGLSDRARAALRDGGAPENVAKAVRHGGNNVANA